MRAGVGVFLSFLTLAGCKDQPSFDERYEAATREVDARVKAIDGEIAESDKAAAAPKERAAPAASSGLPSAARASSAPTSSGE